MPFPKPLNVVVGAPVAFDVARCPGGENVESLDAMVDAFHAQVLSARYCSNRYCDAVDVLTNAMALVAYSLLLLSLA